jgi:hypothetical protein
MKRLTSAGFVLLLAVLAAPAQRGVSEECLGKIHGARDVTRRARILEGPDLSIITRVVEPNVRGVIVLDAVLCRSGRVTDIRIIEGLSPSVNEFTTAAVRLVRFVPAELRWHSVSQRIGFEIHFGGNVPGIKVTTSVDAAGRLVESVNIIGHRRLTTKQILSWIQTRPGESYRLKQIERDLEAILATGHFDKTQTSVTTEDGTHGGVGVTFEVVELPLIAEIKFEGLKLDRSIVFDAWKKERVDLQSGDIYNVETIQAAVRVIKQVLNANGQRNSRVETRTENLTAMTVNLTFVITQDR